MTRKTKIFTVCGAGVGTSNILKVYIDEICEELGEKVEVSNTSVGMIKSKKADLILTSQSFEHLLSDVEAEVIGLKNFMNKNEIRDRLVEYFKRKNS